MKVKIKRLEEKEKQTAVLNMIKILRMLKKDDLIIRKRLKDASKGHGGGGGGGGGRGGGGGGGGCRE